MPNTTTQTAQGQATTVTMDCITGIVPSVIHLRDGTSVKPAADGSISVAFVHAHDLMSAGWGIRVTGGTTHVP